MTTMLTRRRAVQMLAGSAFAPALANAQDADYPSRPVRLIVANAPGSSVDTIGRLVGNQLAATAGVKTFVENKAGATGALGVDAARISVPDGYTLIVASSSSTRSALKRSVPPVKMVGADRPPAR